MNETAKATAHFERDERDGSVTAKFIRFDCEKHAALAADQAWAVARMRYKLRPRAGRDWRLIAVTLD